MNLNRMFVVALSGLTLSLGLACDRSVGDSATKADLVISDEGKANLAKKAEVDAMRKEFLLMLKRFDEKRDAKVGTNEETFLWQARPYSMLKCMEHRGIYGESNEVVAASGRPTQYNAMVAFGPSGDERVAMRLLRLGPKELTAKELESSARWVRADMKASFWSTDPEHTNGAHFFSGFRSDDRTMEFSGHTYIDLRVIVSRSDDAEEHPDEIVLSFRRDISDDSVDTIYGVCE